MTLRYLKVSYTSETDNVHKVKFARVLKLFRSKLGEAIFKEQEDFVVQVSTIHEEAVRSQGKKVWTRLLSSLFLGWHVREEKRKEETGRDETGDETRRETRRDGRRDETGDETRREEKRRFFRQKILPVSKIILDKKKKERKEEQLRKNLRGMSIKAGVAIRMPLNPSVRVRAIEPSGCFMFRSALYPAVISFTRAPPPTEGIKTTSDDLKALISGSDSPKEASYKVIFKSNDDLRQDQVKKKRVYTTCVVGYVVTDNNSHVYSLIVPSLFPCS